MATADFTAAPPQFRTAPPKPRMTVYFALNIISFIAMLLACLFMYLEIRRFEGFGVVPGKVRVSSMERPVQDLFAELQAVHSRTSI